MELQLGMSYVHCRYRQGLRYLDLEIYVAGEPIKPETTSRVKELTIALLVNR